MNVRCSDHYSSHLSLCWGVFIARVVEEEPDDDDDQGGGMMMQIQQHKNNDTFSNGGNPH